MNIQFVDSRWPSISKKLDFRVFCSFRPAVNNVVFDDVTPEDKFSEFSVCLFVLSKLSFHKIKKIQSHRHFNRQPIRTLTCGGQYQAKQQYEAFTDNMSAIDNRLVTSSAWICVARAKI